MASKSIVDNEKLTSLANAIRTKTNTTDSLTIDQMTSAIENISVGSGEDNLKIMFDTTKSSSYLIYNKEVNAGAFLKENHTENVEDASYMFYQSTITNVPSLRFPNLKIADYMFYRNTFKTTDNDGNEIEDTTINNIVQNIDFSKLTSAKYMFYGAGSTHKILLPNNELTNLEYGNYMFANYYSPNTPITLLNEELNFPNAKELNYCFNKGLIEGYKLTISVGSPTRNDNIDCSSMFESYLESKITSTETKRELIFNHLGNGLINARFFGAQIKCHKVTFLSPLKVSNAAYMFNQSSGVNGIETIEGIIDLENASSVDSIVFFCSKLESITLKNIKLNLQIGSGTSWGHKLTLDSLINTCKECINVDASRKLTIGTANMEKISNVYVKFIDPSVTSIATNEKGNVEVCESTDEGAMTIAQYMSLKGWTLA